MIKRYVLLISAILVIIIFTSTSSASFLSSKGRLYERLQENTAFIKILERISQIVSHNDNGILIDADENDEDDDLIDPDGPKDNVLLPETIDIAGEITPDNGNEVVVEGDNLGETPTIDVNGEEGATLNDELAVDENGEVGPTNDITLGKDGEKRRTLERVIEIVTEHNVILGAMLQKVVERTFAPGTTESDGAAENIVDTVVVVGGSGGAAEG